MSDTQSVYQTYEGNSYLFGGNAPYVEEMYESYLANPGSVPDSWREYFDALNHIYDERVPGGADLVCYWFEKARVHIAAGKCTASGLVATNSIRGGANRKVLDGIVKYGRIFEAWSDEPWVNDGAAVRVSLVCFGKPNAKTCELDGFPVAMIHADLTTGVGLNLSAASPLMENPCVCFMGSKKCNKSTAVM